jgi:peptidoglycan/LPS O-acetylase OafA/YrhL
MRIKSLDSLRGIAALTVVLYHCNLIYFSAHGGAPRWVAFSPLRVIFAGHAAVLVFFALSGFVLFLTFRSVDGFRYYPYIAKRFMRIYPPFAFVIVCSALLCVLVKAMPIPPLRDVGGYLLDWDTLTLPTAGVVAGHLAMSDRLQWLDPPMWSLVHEMRISVFFPLIALWVLRDWRMATGATLLISVVSAYLNRTHLFDGWAYQPLNTLQYVFLFAAGATLSLHALEVRAWLSKIPIWARIVLWAAALVFITLSFVDIFSAALLVALCLAPWADAALSHALPTWLGRVSYSLYLVHMPVLYTLMHIFWARMPLTILLACAVLTSLLVSELTYRFVEKPAIRLGRRLASQRFSLPPRVLQSIFSAASSNSVNGRGDVVGCNSNARPNDGALQRINDGRHE